jgi:hypothetical protein
MNIASVGASDAVRSEFSAAPQPDTCNVSCAPRPASAR